LICELAFNADVVHQVVADRRVRAATAHRHAAIESTTASWSIATTIAATTVTTAVAAATSTVASLAIAGGNH
jgi:hypothetical protein